MNLSGCSSSLLSPPKGPSSSSCSALSSHQHQALAGDSSIPWAVCLLQVSPLVLPCCEMPFGQEILPSSALAQVGQDLAGGHLGISPEQSTQLSPFAWSWLQAERAGQGLTLLVNPLCWK